MTRARPAARAAAPEMESPSWSRVLRALREVAGVTRAGWAALLGYGRTTVQRWETGAIVPDAVAEAAILNLCRERALFRTYQSGLLTGQTITPAWLQALLGEARLGSDTAHAPR